MSDKLGDATCTILAALVAILVLLFRPCSILCLRTEGTNTCTHTNTNTHTHSITAQRLTYAASCRCRFVSLFFFVFDTCFRFGDVQFLSCLLIVKVAEALFNSFRNTFVALFVVVVAVKLVAVVASGSAIDMDMPRPWPVRVHACLCACMRATFARPKCKMREEWNEW